MPDNRQSVAGDEDAAVQVQGADHTRPGGAASRGPAPARAGVVTVRVAEDQADAFLDAGQQFTLGRGGNVGHGTVYRWSFTDYGPS